VAGPVGPTGPIAPVAPLYLVISTGGSWMLTKLGGPTQETLHVFIAANLLFCITSLDEDII